MHIDSVDGTVYAKNFSVRHFFRLLIRVDHDSAVTSIYTLIILASHLPSETWVGSGKNAHFWVLL